MECQGIALVTGKRLQSATVPFLKGVFKRSLFWFFVVVVLLIFLFFFSFFFFF